MINSILKNIGYTISAVVLAFSFSYYILIFFGINSDKVFLKLLIETVCAITMIYLISKIENHIVAKILKIIGIITVIALIAFILFQIYNQFL